VIDRSRLRASRSLDENGFIRRSLVVVREIKPSRCLRADKALCLDPIMFIRVFLDFDPLTS
jgi:hypothetical protein